MRTLHVSLALGASATAVALALGCGDSGTGPAPTAQRVVRQEVTSATGVLSNYWLYSYDAAGYTTRVSAYDASNVPTSTTDYGYEGGYQTLATSKDTNGVVTGTTVYVYVGGVLSRANSYSGSGTLTGYSTYLFVNGRKVTTYRFTGGGASLGRTDFTYDTDTGLRTGATGRDSLGTVTMTTTRTYVGGVWTQSQLNYFPSGTSVIRKFTYETGPSVIDKDIFFEF